MKSNTIKSLEELSDFADYTFVDTLTPDPKATTDGEDYYPREIFNGHYVPVKPTPIENPTYITHSKEFFKELGFDDSLANSQDFIKMFSADTSTLPKKMKKLGWATGYALSIYGNEYYDQCPFQTGNAYGDGRAISIFEGVLNGKRWEMQLKGGGKTPYCRGADGRAVLRSSVREFLASEHMYALGIPTSRALSLYTSKTETVRRPWFNDGSYSKDPERMIDEKVAISTRVAPSFLRVGQLELFGRRARKKEHPNALKELEQLVLHIIDREYSSIDQNLTFEQKVLQLANEFAIRLSSLVANWIRVGYCQGNFNSDNCAVGGYTLDYGPFGFIDMFETRYQPWTGGGVHFSFFNQPNAALRNFQMFCLSLKPLFESNQEVLDKLEEIETNFPNIMDEAMKEMWASKLGLETYDEAIFEQLINLMRETGVDYTIFFRELSSIPKDITPIVKSFYSERSHYEKIVDKWNIWLEKWKSKLIYDTTENISIRMKQINPKYSLREWFLVNAYKKADDGDYSLIHELQEIMNNPYDEQTKEIEDKYYRKKPLNLFNIAGISHVSCSS